MGELGGVLHMEAACGDGQRAWKIPAPGLELTLRSGHVSCRGINMRTWIIGAGLAAVALGATAMPWIAPPMRLIAPGIFGMTCAGHVCVEAPDDLAEAGTLVAGAVAAVQAQAGLPVPDPRFVMCRSERCYQSFGGGAERAISYPFLGTLIAGHSWQDYIIRHELIHWLQFEHFGAFETMAHPAWFREGMAYALSGAPSWDVRDAFRPWQAQYLEWQGKRTPAEVLSERPKFE
jgi:hypothetical protein